MTRWVKATEATALAGMVALVARMAEMKLDGDDADPDDPDDEGYVMENDDNWETLSSLITEARELIREFEEGR